MKIGPGSVVRIEYEIRVKGGDVIESSDKAPLQYVHGEGRLLPALEKRLEGLSVGDSREGEIPAAEVVPPADQLPTRVVPRRELSGKGDLAVGALFEARTVEGAAVKLEVVALDDEKVTMRLVPPLAGKDLTFKVKVVRIEDPASHTVSTLRKPPPPLPAEALHIDLEPES
jgi:FKBP-type peptidyl-prolyl cis-trans isomerase 2